MHRDLCIRLKPSAVAFAVLVLLAPGAVPARAAAPSAAVTPVPPMPAMLIEDLAAGQRGYGLSVFGGSTPERFEVEILGVVRNTAPETSMILARLTGHNLEKTGVIAGMSGSPVILDGKIVGAVAGAWPFSHEAVAVITPIDAMRGIARQPERPRAAAMPGIAPAAPAAPSAPSEHRAGQTSDTRALLERMVAPPTGAPDASALLELELRRLAPVASGGVQPAYQWSAGGFGSGTQMLLERGLGAVAPAGLSPLDDASSLVGGGAVAAVLVDGDMRMAATGTVTERNGDEVLAFGHPFLGIGSTAVPMAPAEIVTVLSSSYSSFKLANFGKPVGAFVQDRAPGIFGRVGGEATMVPLAITVAGRSFDLRVADIPQLLPTLVAISALGALDRAASANGPQGLDLDAHFEIAGHGQLRLRQSFDGEQAGVFSALYLLSAVQLLAASPFEDVQVTAIRIDLQRVDVPRTAALVAGHADRTRVEPGDRIGLSFDLLPYRGVLTRRGMVLELPADLPDGRYALLLGDGTSLDAARFAIEPAEPKSFAEVLTILRSLHSRRDLGVLGIYGGKGLAVAGTVMPRLPGSVRAIWGAAASETSAALRQAIAQELIAPVDLPVAGTLRVDLDVHRRPVAAKETN